MDCWEQGLRLIASFLFQCPAAPDNWSPANSPQLQTQRCESTPGFLAGPISVVRACCSGFPSLQVTRRAYHSGVCTIGRFLLVYLLFWTLAQSDSWTCRLPGMAPTLPTSSFSAMKQFSQPSQLHIDNAVSPRLAPRHLFRCRDAQFV
ncbi:hypothetical protein BDW66DRAFT_138690 [Aspergillus desertorum]